MNVNTCLKDFNFDIAGTTYEKCNFVGGRYPNGNIGIDIWSANRGPVSKVTVNTDVILPDDCIAVKDYAECTGMVETLKFFGVIEDGVINTVKVGHAIIPVHKLTEKGKEIFLIEG